MTRLRWILRNFFDAALETGAEDVSQDDDVIEVICDPGDFGGCSLRGLQAAGFEQESAEVSMVSRYDGNSR